MESDDSDNEIEGVVMMDMVPQDSEEEFSGSSEVSGLNKSKCKQILA